MVSQPKVHALCVAVDQGFNPGLHALIGVANPSQLISALIIHDLLNDFVMDGSLITMHLLRKQASYLVLVVHYL